MKNPKPAFLPASSSSNSNLIGRQTTSLSDFSFTFQGLLLASRSVGLSRHAARPPRGNDGGPLLHPNTQKRPPGIWIVFYGEDLPKLSAFFKTPTCSTFQKEAETSNPMDSDLEHSQPVDRVDSTSSSFKESPVLWLRNQKLGFNPKMV